MAVVKCKECGGQVSTKAKACPSCGAKQPKKVGILGWLFVLVVVLPIAWQVGSGMGKADVPAPTPANTSAESAAVVPESEAQTGGWSRHDYQDEMTDAKIQMLTLRSDNGQTFDFPYETPGGSHLSLVFRKNGTDFDAFLKVDKGQMLCGHSECTFSLRVGDGKVQQWTGLRSTTNDSDLMFVRDAKALEAIVKKGGDIRIGIDFHRAGHRAFQFSADKYPGF